MSPKLLLNIVKYYFPLVLICRLDDRTITGTFPARTRDFSFLHSLQTGWNFYIASYLMCTRGPFSGVKWQRREADHPSPYSFEVNKEWSLPSLPTAYAFIVWCLIKNRNNRVCYPCCVLLLKCFGPLLRIISISISLPWIIIFVYLLMNTVNMDYKPPFKNLNCISVTSITNISISYLLYRI
jgi:hypothetical protein